MQIMIIISDEDHLLTLQRLFLIEAKIAGVAIFLAIDHALCATLYAGLVVINSRVKRLGLLQALAADGRFQGIAG